jgi:ribosomal protein S1
VINGTVIGLQARMSIILYPPGRTVSTSSEILVNLMNNLKQLKSKYQLGQFVQGRVEHHAPFGVFIALDEVSAKGLIKIKFLTFWMKA